MTANLVRRFVLLLRMDPIFTPKGLYDFMLLKNKLSDEYQVLRLWLRADIEIASTAHLAHPIPIVTHEGDLSSVILSNDHKSLSGLQHLNI